MKMPEGRGRFVDKLISVVVKNRRVTVTYEKNGEKIPYTFTVKKFEGVRVQK